MASHGHAVAGVAALPIKNEKILEPEIIIGKPATAATFSYPRQ
jgi:hypothetical protein